MKSNKLIETPTQLIAFLKELDAKYDKLSDKEYVALLTERLGVYESHKPANINVAFERIKNFVNLGYAYLPISERPIFMDILTFDD